MHTPKVDRVATPQVLWIQRRHSDDLCLEVGQSLAQTNEIARIRQDGEVNVAAKLGSAV
jgi:hypothetical protein